MFPRPFSTECWINIFRYRIGFVKKRKDLTWSQRFKRLSGSEPPPFNPRTERLGRQSPGMRSPSATLFTAGVAEFFLNLYRIQRKPEYIDFVRHLTSDLLKRGTRDDAGLRWVHAEHRTRPKLLFAQTNLMQGAAGIGLWLLHLDYFEQGKKQRVILPDCPF